MPDTYQYKVRDRDGRLLSGELEGDSTALVAERLRQMGYVPVAIDRQATSALAREVRIPGVGDRVRLRDLAVFSRQFATIVDAGLPLVRALHLLAEQTESRVLADVVVAVRLDVERGSSLSQALAKHPKVFGRLYVAMVRAGEAGGVLDRVLLQLAGAIERQLKLRHTVLSAVTYPAAVLGLVVVIVAAMLVFVVPMFEGMYDDLGGSLPVPTRLLLGVSTLATRLLPLLAVAGVAAAVAARRWVGTERGRAAWDGARLRVPVFGALVHKSAIVRLARTCSVLLDAGVPLLDALDISADTVGCAPVAAAVRDVQGAVKRGDSVARRLADHHVIPPMVSQMVAIGEETGSVGAMLAKVGEFYEQEVESAVGSLTSLLEPLLIVVMGVTVGAMVVALYLPMFNIINLVQ